MLKYGFKLTHSDHTLFVQFSSTTRIAILIVYVDDIILIGDDTKGIKFIKDQLSKEFEVKDLGSLRYFLRMEVSRTKNEMCISHRKYILDLLNETGMLGCKPAPTPMETGRKTKKEWDKTPTDRLQYQRLVGKLIYLSHTRSDICFAVSFVAKFMHDPTNEHFKVVMRILRYLKVTPGQGLSFKKQADRRILVYTDADWAGSKTNMRSTTGYETYIW